LTLVLVEFWLLLMALLTRNIMSRQPAPSLRYQYFEEHCNVDILTFIMLLDHKPGTTQSGNPMVLAEVLPTPRLGVMALSS